MIVRFGRVVYMVALFVTPGSRLYGQLAGTATAEVGTRLTGGAALTLSQSRSGVWLGAAARWDAPRIPGVMLPDVTTGGWRQFGNLFATLSATGRGLRRSEEHVTTRQMSYAYTLRDSVTGESREISGYRLVSDTTHLAALTRSLDLEAALRLTGARWSGMVAGGHRIGGAGVHTVSWFRSEATFLVRRPVSLVLGAGVMPDFRLSTGAVRPRFTAGLRLGLGRFAPDGDATMPAATVMATRFSIEPYQSGSWRVLVRAPHARVVELSGDLTGWRPIRLRRLDEEQWALILRAVPGVHRVNLRIDGGPWQAPPGTTTIDDDFAGEVGLVVIE